MVHSIQVWHPGARFGPVHVYVCKFFDLADISNSFNPVVHNYTISLVVQNLSFALAGGIHFSILTIIQGSFRIIMLAFQLLSIYDKRNQSKAFSFNLASLAENPVTICTLQDAYSTTLSPALHCSFDTSEDMSGLFTSTKDRTLKLESITPSSALLQ